MTSFRLPSRLSKVYFILFASSALAFLPVQNVTVDDAVLTGPVVPNYLPNNSNWTSDGMNCTLLCPARPDHVLAYKGTWHETVYYPSGNFVPAIEISFTGNALYIFFIIANTLPGLLKLTNIYFELDNINASSYIHNPDNTTDYQYNVPVYANSDLDFGPHTMVIQPVLAGTNIVMMFDYFIYSTNASIDSSTSTTSPSTASISSLSATPISSSSATSIISSEPSPPSGGTSGLYIGVIVGGTVGGVFLLLATSLLCYWIYKRHHGGRSSVDERIPLGVPNSRKCISPNSSIESSAPARPRSPDFNAMMRGIDKRRKQLPLRS